METTLETTETKTLLTEEALLVEGLKQIRLEMDLLTKEKSEIEAKLPEQVIYQNNDGTWTRFQKIDNVINLQEKETLFRASSVSLYTIKLENLKNKPKELI